MKSNYYFAGIDVILIDAGDVFTMISLYDGKIHNIARAAGADMLAENENRIVDDYEMNSILSAAGIILESFQEVNSNNDEGAKRLMNALSHDEVANGWTDYANANS